MALKQFLMPGSGRCFGCEAYSSIHGAKALKKGAQKLKGIPEASKEILAKTQGFLSGVGEDVARTWIDKADEVGQALFRTWKRPSLVRSRNYKYPTTKYCSY